MPQAAHNERDTTPLFFEAITPRITHNGEEKKSPYCDDHKNSL